MLHSIVSVSLSYGPEEVPFLEISPWRSLTNDFFLHIDTPFGGSRIPAAKQAGSSDICHRSGTQEARPGYENKVVAVREVHHSDFPLRKNLPFSCKKLNPQLLASLEPILTFKLKPHDSPGALTND